MTDPIALGNRRDRGVAMFITVLILVIMGWLGLSALDTATRDQQLAGYQNRSRSAFMAATAGVAAARSLVFQQDQRSATPALPLTKLGDAAMYSRWQQQPSFEGDPNVTLPPIHWVTDIPANNGFNMANGRFAYALWQINVLGQSYDASGGAGGQRTTDRIEAIASKLMSSTASGYGN